jgi:ATP/maltotriose-dependent transcriptional regulator MalT
MLRKKEHTIAPYLIILTVVVAFVLSSAVICRGEARKAPRQAPPPKVTQPREITINDVNIQAVFKTGEELFKQGKTDESLRTFLGIYRYSRDMLTFLEIVRPNYEKLLNENPSLSQEEKEELYIKQKRVRDLTTRYSSLRIESAYYVGALYAKRGDAEQARKYLLEVCQTASFSLNPKSTWVKSKNLLLALFQLEGEF